MGSSLRWQWLLDGFPESGGNAGDNLALFNYADNGAWLGQQPLTITRATGLVTLAGDPTANLGVATKQYVDALRTLYLPLTGGVVTGNVSAYSLTIGNGHVGTIPATAFGGAIEWDLSNGGGEINFFNAFTAASPNSFTWNQVTAAGVQTQLAGLTNAGALRLTSGLGLFGGFAVTSKPTVTGAKGSNAALAYLLTALASYGLITDSSSA